MKKTSTLFFLAILASMLLGSVGASAQQVSPQEAINRASRFVKRSGAAKGQASQQFTVAQTAQKDGQTLYYVLNNASLGEEGGFVIVGGDERARTILAYSEGGQFDANRVPANVQWWLNQYSNQIANAIESGQAARHRAAPDRDDIAPMLTTKWDQSEPFNSAIPSLGEAYVGIYAFATGCLATAMAQVMNYYKYPTKGTGKASYEIDYGLDEPMTFSANFGETTYDWDNMIDVYEFYPTTTYNDVQAKAVATLMYHAGVSLQMIYNSIIAGGSAAEDSHLSNALINHFGYDKSVARTLRDFYSDEQWEQMMYDELAQKRPILYGGNTEPTDEEGEVAGHAFVIDGYNASNGLFHVNWGWGGLCDGDFQLTGADALHPVDQGIGGDEDLGAYTEGHTAFLNIMPDKGGDYCMIVATVERPTLWEDFRVKEGTDENEFVNQLPSLTIDRQTPNADVDRIMGAVPMNLSATDIDVIYGVKLVSTATGAAYYAPMLVYGMDKLGPLEPSAAYNSPMPMKFNTSVAPYNGTYELRPVCRKKSSQSDDDWVELLVEYPYTAPTLTIKGGEDDPAVGIDAPIATEADAAAYTLQGIRVGEDYKGIVIKGGKKVMQK